MSTTCSSWGVKISGKAWRDVEGLLWATWLKPGSSSSQPLLLLYLAMRPRETKSLRPFITQYADYRTSMCSRSALMQIQVKNRSSCMVYDVRGSVLSQPTYNLSCNWWPNKPTKTGQSMLLSRITTNHKKFSMISPRSCAPGNSRTIEKL